MAFGWVLVLLSGLLSGQSLSERSAAVSGEDFLDAFLGNCAQNPGDIVSVSNAAQALGYRPLPSSLAPLIAPSNPDAEFEGYLVTEGQGAPFLLGLSVAIDQGVMLETCSVANPFLGWEDLDQTLLDWAEIGSPDEEETIAGQRYRLWFVDHIAPDAFLAAMDASPRSMPGATLSITAPSHDE